MPTGPTVNRPGFFTKNISLSDNDRARAKDANVVLLDEHELEYYEKLVVHLGPAAKYQFLADLMPGKDVPGLRIRVPAIRHKLGGTYCYNFTASPDYLLKICYVSHRSKGKASDVDAYQRMVNKTRLTKIRKHIAQNGYFPTSIVVNLESNRIRFERVKQEGEGDFVYVDPPYTVSHNNNAFVKYNDVLFSWTKCV